MAGHFSKKYRSLNKHRISIAQGALNIWHLNVGALGMLFAWIVCCLLFLFCLVFWACARALDLIIKLSAIKSKAIAIIINRNDDDDNDFVNSTARPTPTLATPSKDPTQLHQRNADGAFIVLLTIEIFSTNPFVSVYFFRKGYNAIKMNFIITMRIR